MFLGKYQDAKISLTDYSNDEIREQAYKLAITILPLPRCYHDLEIAGMIFCYHQYYKLKQQYYKNV